MNRLFALILPLFIVTYTQGQVLNPLHRVNSEYDEQNPVLAPDGRTLYFTRAFHPQNIGGERDPGDIWFSTITNDGSWSDPQNALPLNNRNWNGLLGFVGGSDVAYLMGHYAQGNADVKSQGIARAIKTSMGWSTPENFKIPYFRNTSENHGGHIMSDAGIAVFSLETYGGKGGEDIYVAFNKGNGQWSEPKNLGTTINTVYQEFDPYLSPDGITIFYSSNSKGQNTEIYKSTRLDDTWVNWSAPEPINELNTPGKERGYKAYGNEVMYTSTLNSDGYGDIRSFEYPDTIPVNDSLPEIVPQIVDELSPGIIKLFGVLTQQKEQGEIPVISLRSTTGEVLNESQVVNGRYSLLLDNLRGDFLLRIDAPGFITAQQNLSIDGDEKFIERNFVLQPIAIGTTVNLQDVLFKQSKAEFLPSSYPQLNLVVDFLRNNPKVKIRLEGHTDNRGVQKYNVKLSQDRVEAVKDYLLRKGIGKKRISGKGYGGSRPIADNENPDTRILNRRVEFTIVKD